MRVSEERARSFGEVLTPTWMVEEMLTPLAEAVAAPSKLFLDLCAGPGAFIVNALEQRLNAVSPYASLRHYVRCLVSMYAIELLADNISALKVNLLTVVRESTPHLASSDRSKLLRIAEQIYNVNVIQADVLTEQIMIPIWQVETLGTTAWDENAISSLFTLAPLEDVSFSVIISNPPYQKNVSGSTEDARLRNHSKALPIYHKFYDFARNLNPELMCFIMPAKWYTGGWGLDAWRVSVLEDIHVAQISDYRDSGHIFEGTEVNGGICWILRDLNHEGETQVKRHDRSGALVSDVSRPLLEPGADFFVRDEQALSILRKVGSFNLDEHNRFSSMILGTTPYGLNSNFKDYAESQDTEHPVQLFYIKERKFWIRPEQVTRNADTVDSWKVFLSLSFNQHSPQIIGKPHIFGPGVVCTHSYVAIPGFSSESEALNCTSYMKTKFFRFLAGQLKISPIATRNVYRLIPIQDWSVGWTDEKLFMAYGFSEEEIKYIEQRISTME